MTSYERIEAYQAAHELVTAVYRLTRLLPPEERSGLVAQLRRAAVAVAVNIAEGSARKGGREFRRALDVSLGALSEVACLMRLARDLGFCAGPVWDATDRLRHRTGRVLWGLYRSL